MTDTKNCSKPIKLLTLSYHMGSNWLFQNLNATFEPGITAIIGENGCGKSTLLRILSGICAPSKGHVLSHGIDLYQNNRHFKNQIGYVPNTPFLYSHLTVLENLHFVGKLKKCEAAAFKKILALTLERCDLTAWQHILFQQLSDGLKKRACIASMLLHNPNILILDEPCSELDPLQRESLWEIFKQLRTEKKCIIFTSHHVAEIQSLCDEIYILNQGLFNRVATHHPSPALFSPSFTQPVKMTEGETL